MMTMLQTRRRFLINLALAGAAGLTHKPALLAAEGSLETTTIRLAKNSGICIAPQYAAEELLRAEGFTEIHYIETQAEATSEAIARSDVDFSMAHASYWVPAIDAGKPVILLAGVHVGCFELFAREGIRGVAAESRRIGQHRQNALELHDRSGPAVR